MTQNVTSSPDATQRREMHASLSWKEQRRGDRHPHDGAWPTGGQGHFEAVQGRLRPGRASQAPGSLKPQGFAP